MKLPFFVKTRVLPPPATFDGLLPRGIIIQSIDEFSMTGVIVPTLSRGISAYLASRVGCISAPTLYFEMLKCSNPNRHHMELGYIYSPIDQGSFYPYPWESLSLDLGYPARSCQCWPGITMKINCRRRAN